MKKLYVLSLFAVSVAFGYGCDGNKAGLKKDLAQFMGSEITLPEFAHAMYDGRDTVARPDADKPARMVILFDSTVCGSCKISQIWEWGIITDFAKVMQGEFEPVFIFAPSERNERDLLLALRVHPFEWPVYIDKEQKFLSANPDMPKNKAMHTFLLDRDGRVVLVGEPVNNTKLWDLYKTTIGRLIDNDGALPPEA